MLDIASSVVPSPVQLSFTGFRSGEIECVGLNVDNLVVAGWAGRDREAIEKHIRELEAIGVGRPRSIPTYYRLSASLLTHAPCIDVVGRESSGEAEVVLLHAEDGYWITVGSDHTDRKLEAVGVTLSKQICAKPIAGDCWRLDDLRDHWDEMILRTRIVVGGIEEVYQEATTASLRTPESLVEEYSSLRKGFPVGSVMFCGTVPVLGHMRFADQVTLELVDPVLGRTLEHSYRVRALEIADDF